MGEEGENRFHPIRIPSSAAHQEMGGTFSLREKGGTQIRGIYSVSSSTSNSSSSSSHSGRGWGPAIIPAISGSSPPSLEGAEAFFSRTSARRRSFSFWRSIRAFSRARLFAVGGVLLAIQAPPDG